MAKTVFVSKETKYLQFSERPLGMEENLTSEGISVEEVEINGALGLMSWTAERTIIAWSLGGRLFVLDVTENRSVAMKIAHSVTPIE